MNDKSNKEETIQKPGADIRPPISSTDQVISLAERLYGIKIKTIKQLDGYDDKNYHLMLSEDEPFNENTNISSVWPHGYVLKILNSLDTKDIGFVEAQTKLLIHVGNQGICVPKPVINVKGKFISVEPLKSKNGENVTYHAVRLFKYHKGILLKNVTSIKSLPSSVFSDLFYDVGQKTAILDNIMKDFQDDVLSNRTSLWHMKSALKIKDFLFVIKEEEKVRLVLKVLKEFEETVISKLTELKTGLLHGDVNESNMLVENQNDYDNEHLSGYKVSVILDFGDIQVSSYVLELAVVMCYMMLQTGSLDSGASVLQGYHSVNPLPIDEYKLLPISICARLCQSLVLGMYTFTKVDPSNHYVLLTQAAGWDLLKKITSTDREIINKLWLKDILCK